MPFFIWWIFILLTTAPVGPPTDINISISATSVTLQWLPPYDPEGEVISYGITYHLVESSANITTPRPDVTISDIYETQVILEPLLQQSQYLAVIYAITGVGVGPASEQLTLVTTAPGKSRQQEERNKTINVFLKSFFYFTLYESSGTHDCFWKKLTMGTTQL